MQSGCSVTYIATSVVNPEDGEWQRRIQQHRQRRPEDWWVQEVPVELAAAIANAPSDRCLLVDSLGTWLANLLDQDEATWNQTCADLLQALQQTPALVILVAEETGWGVVPAYPLGRQFRDRLGQLTRQIGAISQAVYLVVAGYAIDLRQCGKPVNPPNE